MAKKKTPETPEPAKPKAKAKAPAKAAEPTPAPVAKAAAPKPAKPVAAAPAPVKVVPKPTTEQISKRAYEIWVAKGKPHGKDLENWKQAELELGA